MVHLYADGGAKGAAGLSRCIVAGGAGRQVLAVRDAHLGFEVRTVSHRVRAGSDQYWTAVC